MVDSFRSQVKLGSLHLRLSPIAHSTLGLQLVFTVSSKIEFSSQMSRQPSLTLPTQHQAPHPDGAKQGAAMCGFPLLTATHGEKTLS